MNALEVRHVSKTYRIPHERHTTLAERLLTLFRPRQIELLRALDDVSLEVPPGAFVGVIGANGSGKSTLLKILAGVLVPDTGDVEVDGTLTPLLELGLGFHQELSVRENVQLYGTVLGYPRAGLARRVDEVIGFAGLERFQDAKLKSLSSGMLMRLAFATAIRADADIILLDEVLAVGDAQFQRKCIDIFTEFKRQRKTIVLVSHDLAAVQRFCDRVYWLDRGRVVMNGEASEVVQTYLGVLQTVTIDSLTLDGAATAAHRWGDGRVRFVDGGLEDETGEPVASVQAGRRLVLRLIAHVAEDSEDPVFGFIVRLGGQIVYSVNNLLLALASGSFASGDRIEVRMPFTAALANGHYSVDVAVASGKQGTVHDWVNHFAAFVVERSPCHEGVADLAAEFHCRAARAGEVP